ncbi:MAG: serine--tRNA ligase [Ureaplasma sp.]|nr:serine--tRNA ligase [Ureaplasma sp.]
MFNIDLIRNETDLVKQKLKDKNFKDIEIIDDIFKLDIKNREFKTALQKLNNEKNVLSKEMGILIAQKKQKEFNKKQKEVNKIKKEISKLEVQASETNDKIQDLLLIIPNICDDSVVIGQDENSNKPIKYFSEPTKFEFEPLPHWDLAKKLNLIDFERAAKISGSRFTVYTNKGARLFRALQQFTLDHNTEQGFTEILPPVIVLDESLKGSGQLPKFEEDVFKLTERNFYLSPTAEVQLLNMHRDEIISSNQFPIRYTANTPCFRSEAGSAGRDTRGVIRQHQFWKSELVIFTTPDKSWDEHEYMTRTAEMILEKLNLPYRRLLLCTGDTGFCSAKTYDLEVWLPSYNEYKEISSCSNCLDFQARRAKIRSKINDKNEFIHTLNGSSLAIDRLWAAVVENYQQEDGSIKVPEALLPYLNEEFIK